MVSTDEVNQHDQQQQKAEVRNDSKQDAKENEMKEKEDEECNVKNGLVGIGMPCLILIVNRRIITILILIYK